MTKKQAMIWACAQRTLYNQKRLCPERIILLENTEGWSWTPLEDQFNQRLEQYRKNPESPEMKQWAANYRTNYRKGKLSKEKIEAIESLPNWTWSARVGKCCCNRWRWFFKSPCNRMSSWL